MLGIESKKERETYWLPTLILRKIIASKEEEETFGG